MAQAVTRGIDQLLRLDFPQGNTEFDLKNHIGRTVDALEMIDALEVMRHFFEDTRGMFISGKSLPMYRGETEFDFIHDIKQSVEGYFLVGEDTKESALCRRKNRSMIFLMLNPLVDLFQNKTHEEMLSEYNDVIDEAINHINNTEINATADDAFVVRHIIQKEVAKRNKIQAQVDGIMRLRRRKRKKKRKKK